MALNEDSGTVRTQVLSIKPIPTLCTIITWLKKMNKKGVLPCPTKLLLKPPLIKYETKQTRTKVSLTRKIKMKTPQENGHSLNGCFEKNWIPRLVGNPSMKTDK